MLWFESPSSGPCVVLPVTPATDGTASSTSCTLIASFNERCRAQKIGETTGSTSDTSLRCRLQPSVQCCTVLRQLVEGDVASDMMHLRAMEPSEGSQAVLSVSQTTATRKKNKKDDFKSVRKWRTAVVQEVDGAGDTGGVAGKKKRIKGQKKKEVEPRKDKDDEDAILGGGDASTGYFTGSGGARQSAEEDGEAQENCCSTQQ